MPFDQSSGPKELLGCLKVTARVVPSLIFNPRLGCTVANPGALSRIPSSRTLSGHRFRSCDGSCAFVDCPAE